jgi:hypothetical protein
MGKPVTGFSYGKREKKMLAWGAAFLLGVLRKMGCRTWFLDGENVVDSW